MPTVHVDMDEGTRDGLELTWVGFKRKQPRKWAEIEAQIVHVFLSGLGLGLVCGYGCACWHRFPVPFKN